MPTSPALIALATAMTVLQPRRPIVGRLDLGIASGASKYAASHSSAKPQQKRFRLLRKAVWAKPERWLRAAGIWCQHVGHRAGPDWLKLVACRLGIKCFQMSNLCIKLSYPVGECPVFIESLIELARKVDNREVPIHFVAHCQKALRGLQRAIQSTETDSDINWHINSPAGCVATPTVAGRVPDVETSRSCLGRGQSLRSAA